MVLLLVSVILAVIILHLTITNDSKELIYKDASTVPSAYTVIVLGASVRPDGSLSPILKDRVDTALELYQTKKVKRILVSGDHGQVEYDEVNAMKSYLMEQGVPIEDIFLDHAGFDTYDSMYRAQRIFQVDTAIVVTQDFHLPRAVYIGNKMDMRVYGVSADKRVYPSNDHLQRREWLANLKAWYELNIDQRPTYEGDVIPITGNSALSHDQ